MASNKYKLLRNKAAVDNKVAVADNNSAVMGVAIKVVAGQSKAAAVVVIKAVVKTEVVATIKVVVRTEAEEVETKVAAETIKVAARTVAVAIRVAVAKTKVVAVVKAAASVSNTDCQSVLPRFPIRQALLFENGHF